MIAVEFPRISPLEDVTFSYTDYSSIRMTEASSALVAEGVVRAISNGRRFNLLGMEEERKTELLTISSRRGWIAIQEKICNEQELEHTLVFFPKIEHATTYLLAGKYSGFGGPWSSYPSSVGVLTYSIDLKNGVGSFLELQSSVNHTVPDVKTLFQAEAAQGVNLKNYYSHWKFDLIHLAINFFENLGVSKLRIKDPASTKGEMYNRAISIDLVRDACPALKQSPELVSEDLAFGNRMLWQEFTLSP